MPRDVDGALGWLEKAADQGFAESLNNLAYYYATCADDARRDPERAQGYARRLEREPQTSEILDTLACVHAANGRFAEAQAAIDQAIAQLEADTERPGQVRNALLAEFRGHAALFRDGKPHREPVRP